MKNRKYYLDRFANYPEVVTLPQFCEMLGGIGDSTARKLMRENHVRHYYIPRSVRAAEAAENGKSIFKHDRRGKVAEAYTALSKEVNGIGREAYRSRSDGAR